MMVDKKMVGGRPRFALPREIGQIQVAVELEDNELTILEELVDPGAAS